MAPATFAPGRILNVHLFQTSLLLGSLCFGLGAGWIHVKAELAQLLINRAWEQTLDAPEQDFTPWPWADTEPVARLKLPSNKIMVVLKGSQGNSLAFGPGLVEGSDRPGQGFSVIGGHRDTHFAELENVKLGQALAIQNSQGQWIDYRVTDATVIDIGQVALEKELADKILLVTCYPFNTINSNPDKRWVVTAERLNIEN